MNGIVLIINGFILAGAIIFLTDGFAIFIAIGEVEISIACGCAWMFFGIMCLEKAWMIDINQ
ncbi:MAG: hypothetical protein QXH42_09755 [Thermoplasmata archaeon]